MDASESGRGRGTINFSCHIAEAPGQLAGYVGEESPVEGAWVEEEKSSCSNRAFLELLSCNSFKRFSLSSSRFSLSRSYRSLARESAQLVLLLSLLDVVDGTPVQQLLRRRLRLRQQTPPGRQGGETQVDLSEQPMAKGLEAGEVEEIVIAVARGERNQKQPGASQERGPALAIL